MEYAARSCLLIGLVSTIIMLAQGKGPYEYCMTDTFTAECQPNEVIKITSALLGRMKIGKCVKQSMGYLGCKKDVISILSAVCSGREKCTYAVRSDKLGLLDIQPCGELHAYLDMTYDCVPVLSQPTRECESSSVLYTSDSEGYISSYVARKSQCGSMAHPWRIKVQPGERVNFTLHSFETHSKSAMKCRPLGYIAERGHRNNITICSKTGGVEHVYTSNGRQLQIHLKTEATADEDSDFLLNYKVFGCADIKVPVNGWYKREGDVAIIGCESQDIRWTLKCENSQWTGVVGNCSENASIQKPSDWVSAPFDLKTLTILCIAVGFVILIIIAATVIIWKWRESSQHKPPSSILLGEDQYRLKQGPLPPIPENNSHYRSLIRQPDPQTFPQHSHTMPRPSPQDMQQGDYSDYSSDWKFGTAPWHKQNA